MRNALITLSPEGAIIVRRLAESLGDAQVYLHQDVASLPGEEIFSGILALTTEIFGRFGGLIYVVPCGVAVRAIAPHLGSKLSDPAVVVVDVGGRYAVSLLAGHEGGANELALQIANIIGGEPVITTTTEALKNLIVGVGCRRGVSTERIVAAVQEALAEVGGKLQQVRFLASADVKAGEEGLIRAAQELQVPLRFISGEEIRATARKFTPSPLALKKINLPAVAEPAALLAGRRTQLILPRRTYQGITVAIARESLLWSASAPADH
ncbi:MAG: cobalamin biosynthesis protein [Syntrophales bacterium]